MHFITTLCSIVRLASAEPLLDLAASVGSADRLARVDRFHQGTKASAAKSHGVSHLSAHAVDVRQNPLDLGIAILSDRHFDELLKDQVVLR